MLPAAAAKDLGFILSVLTIGCLAPLAPPALLCVAGDCGTLGALEGALLADTDAAPLAHTEAASLADAEAASVPAREPGALGP